MTPSSRGEPPTKLTARRLQFLYGDLRFEKAEIEELLGCTRMELNIVQVHAGIDRGFTSYGDLYLQDLEVIAELIGVPITWTSGDTLGAIRRAFRAEIQRAARAGTLDWKLIDVSIDHLPRLLARTRRRAAAPEDLARARTLRERAQRNAGTAAQ